MKHDSAVSRKRGPSKSPRRQAAEAAGLSRSQTWRIMQVGEVPDDLFEELVESDNPPTVSELVEIGRQHRGLSKSKTARRLKACPHCGGDLTDE